VRDHLKANGLPLLTDAEIEDAACRESGLGAPWCGGYVEPPVGKAPYLTLGVAARFLNTMLGVIRDRKFVPVAEALRRAEICKACPMATSIGGCQGCMAIFRTVDRLMKKNPVVMTKEQEFCGACGCRLSLKTHLYNSTLDRAEEGNKPPYHPSCWRLGN
jgi:hypothetical protein